MDKVYYSGEYLEETATTATEDDNRDYDAEYEESRQYQDYCNGF